MSAKEALERSGNAVPTWVRAARAADIAPLTGTTVRVGMLELALFRLSDGAFRVVENRCPHKNGVLAEGIVSGGFVFCPMHDRKIDLTSGHVQKPDSGCVQTYAVELHGGDVYIAVP